MNAFEGPNWQIIVGDSLDALLTVADGAARLVFADPPYNLGVDYGNGAKADRLPRAEYVAWCRRWIAACAAKLTPDGSLWVLINHENAAHVYLALEEAGLHWRDTITWYETFGVNCTRKFNRTSRPLFHFARHPRRFVFHAGAVRRSSDRLAIYNDKRANPAGKTWDDVWEIPRLAGTHKERLAGFPTQLPLALLRPVIGCASDSGDLVLDPFAGSGTAGVAALETGRRFLGIEKEARFAERAATRLRQVARPGALA